MQSRLPHLKSKYNLIESVEEYVLSTEDSNVLSHLNHWSDNVVFTEYILIF